MTIEAYLAELERRLPRTHRQRLVAEAEEHLRDAAERYRRSGCEEHAAERAAIESFGDVSLVARRVSTASAVQDVRRAAGLAFAAVVVLVLPLYGIPENTLPPARWDAKPADIAVLQSLAIGLWAVGLVLAFAGVACALSRHVRLVAPVVAASAVTVAGLWIVGVVLTVRWFAAAPWTPAWPFVGLALPISLACLAVTVGATVWVHARSREMSELLLQD